ncbi:MAG TPA: hypothetical protein PKA00_03430 [Saprospiraceae bacterium]|nr:hypothetical protein [Saprospiraceae bacterium]HMQ81928.1 hypothetical protein [Saprospiraceae bacterium]
MLKFTKHSLQKLEHLFEELTYKVRYEKGNFQSGYCIVEAQQVAVINKFFDTESRINSLLDILSQIEVKEEQLSPKSLQFFKSIQNLRTSAEEEE